MTAAASVRLAVKALAAAEPDIHCCRVNNDGLWLHVFDLPNSTVNSGEADVFLSLLEDAGFQGVELVSYTGYKTAASTTGALIRARKSF